jgi:cytochrome c biogenesis protein CcmG/thiol:disulfide interchange protein DsbE
VSRVRGGPVLARWLLPPLALLLAACTATETPPPSPAEDAASPFTDCGALNAPPAAASAPAPAAGSGAAPVSDRAAPAASAPGSADLGGLLAAGLPDVSLPCFTGGQSFGLASLRGPAVVNLWASSCAPCREELPLLQELADRTAGRLHVVGVDTFDARAAGASFAADKGVTFPTLFDPGKKLLNALGKINLPVTVFVGADGGRFVYTGKALDKPTLGGLVRAHTGVTVTE